MEKYLQSCKSKFWNKVFKAELDYIAHQLKGDKNVLSIGCGPAIIEAGLAEQGFNVTSLDISKEVLNEAPDNIRTIEGSVENMDFEDSSFDAVLYVASLQFIGEYKEAIKQSFRVLKAGGRVLLMLLNAESGFFKEKIKDPDSYINKIKHINLKAIREVVANYFHTETEYFLGIKGEEIFPSCDSRTASLYIIKGKKK